MADRRVTAQAGNLFCLVRTIHRQHDILMTPAASRLRDPAIPLLNFDRVGEVPAGEREGMEKTIEGFGGVLAHEIVRRMAIVAPSHRAVTRF